MTSPEQRSVPTPVVGALGLLALGLVLLGVGGFVQFDDTSGFGSDQWVLPLGFIAALVALAGVGVACVSAQSRLWLGGALGLLDVFLLWQSITNDGFRFVWGGDEGELFMFQVALGLTALVLIATGLQPATPRRTGGGAGRWLVRGAAYACGTAVLAYFAFGAGAAHYEQANDCVNNDCDLGGLEAMVWSMASIVICAVIAVAVEVGLWIARRRRRSAGTHA